MKKTKIKNNKVHKDLSLKLVRDRYLNNVRELISYQNGPEELAANTAEINNYTVKNLKQSIKNLSFDDEDLISKTDEIRKAANSLYKKTLEKTKIAQEKVEAKRTKLLDACIVDFDKKLEGKGYYFSEHFYIINESNIEALCKSKSASDIATFILEGYDDANFGSTPIEEGTFVTDYRLPCNATAKFEIFLSMQSLDYEDTASLAEFFIGKRVNLAEMVGKPIDRDDLYDGDLLISDAIHIVHKGDFLPLDLSNKSEAEKKCISKSLLKVYQMYNHISKVFEEDNGYDEDDDDYYYDDGSTIKSLSEYKGIGPEHEVFFNHSIIS